MSLPSGARRPAKKIHLWSPPAFGEMWSGEFPATDPVVRTPLAAIDPAVDPAREVRQYSLEI